MTPGRWMRALDLEESLVRQSAMVYRSYGRTLLRSERRDDVPIAASCLTLAAVYFSLTSPEEAPSHYLEARDLYARLSRPYAVTLGICGRAEVPIEPEIFKAGDGPSTDETPDAALANLLLESLDYRDSEYRAKRRESDGLLIGRLRLPRHVYLAALNEAAGWRGHKTTERSTEFLWRASEPIRTATQDSSHWRHMLSGVLPVEPEIIAACLCLLRLHSEHVADFARAIESAEQLDALARVPFEVAVRMNGLLTVDDNSNALAR